MGDWDGNVLQKARKVAVLIVGSTVTLVGIALIFLPGPAIIVIPAGLAILALEFSWAKRWLLKARQYAAIATEKARSKLKQSSVRTTESVYPELMSAISPLAASNLLQNAQAILIDVREVDEHAAEHISASSLFPSSTPSLNGFPIVDANKTALLLCRSGKRAAHMAGLLQTAGWSNVRVIDGGLQAWKAAGLPVAIASKRYIPIMRQVMIGAGLMVAAFTALGAFVNPWFLIGAGFVGAGLAFSGISGICMMENILRKMPWNRIAPKCATKNI